MIEIGTKVVVTTEFRGVFFGTIQEYDTAARTITLTDARNCIYWPASVRGFGGLSVTGPLAGSKVGPAILEIDLFGLTSVDACSDEAIKAWEAGPWA